MSRTQRLPLLPPMQPPCLGLSHSYPQPDSLPNSELCTHTCTHLRTPPPDSYKHLRLQCRHSTTSPPPPPTLVRCLSQWHQRPPSSGPNLSHPHALPLSHPQPICQETLSVLLSEPIQNPSPSHHLHCHLLALSHCHFPPKLVEQAPRPLCLLSRPLYPVSAAARMVLLKPVR